MPSPERKWTKWHAGCEVAQLIPLLLAVIVAVHVDVVFAQGQISGRVLDAQHAEHLVGVSVFVKGTTLGTATDPDGGFALNVDAFPQTIVFSMIGYQTTSVALVDGTEDLVVKLHPRLVDLQPVVVSASRQEERRSDAPVAVSALSSREIESRKPNMLYEALRMMPGVHVTNLGNEQHNMSIRQPLSYRALYLYLEDGVPIRPTGIFNHNALIEVNMAGIERVEVVRGPSSSLFGSNAVGGAVNFITPRPAPRPEGALSLRTDNHGYRRADFSASTTSGRLGMWAGGYVANQQGGWTDHSDFQKVSISLRSDYTFAPATRLTTTYSANYLNTDTNANLDSLSFHRRSTSSLQTFTYRQVDAHRLTSRLHHVWNGRHSTQAALFVRRNSVEQLPHYRIRNQPDPARARGELNEDRFWSLGGDVQHRTYFAFKEARMIAGLGFDRSPNRYLAHYLDVVRDPENGRYVDYSLRDSVLTDYQVELVNASAYVQFEVSPVRRVKLVGSLRFDRIRYGFDNHLPPSAFSGAPDAVDRFDRLSPRAGLTYDLGRGSGVYANVSQGFLPPEVSQLYNGVKIPTLRPSTFNNHEAGGWTEMLDGRLYLEASLYRMDGRDEIISIRTEDGSAENRNAGRTRHFGVEYAAIYTPVRSLSLRFSGTNARHTFVRYEDQGERFDGNLMDAAPDWIGTAELLYRPSFLPMTRVALEWEHLGGYFMDPQNTLRYDGHDLLNLRLGYTMPRGLEVWMNVQNLTDAYYANIASKTRFGQQYSPGAPRSISLGVGYRGGAR